MKNDYLNAVIRSIRSDDPVGMWFNFLLSRKKIRIILKEGSEKKYKTLGFLSAICLIFLTGSAISLLTAVIFKDLLCFVMTIPLAAAFLFAKNKKRLLTAELSRSIIEKIYTPQEIESFTLFSICEDLSSRFQTPSLVDFLDGLSNIRFYTVFISGAALLCLSLSLFLFADILLLAVICMLAGLFFESPFFFRFIR